LDTLPTTTNLEEQNTIEKPKSQMLVFLRQCGIGKNQMRQAALPQGPLPSLPIPCSAAGVRNLSFNRSVTKEPQ
jgi:hypothetical protein